MEALVAFVDVVLLVELEADRVVADEQPETGRERTALRRIVPRYAASHSVVVLEGLDVHPVLDVASVRVPELPEVVGALQSVDELEVAKQRNGAEEGARAAALEAGYRRERYRALVDRVPAEMYNLSR